MKKLNAGYLEFFFFRYGVIVVLAHVLILPVYFFSQDKDPVLLFSISGVSFMFLLFICSSEYFRLKKNISLSDVFLNGDQLIINEITYSSQQIEKIIYRPVRNALDKFPTYFFEIEIGDGSTFYFLDKPMNWKFQSRTLNLLKKHPVFSLKTEEKSESSEGFSVFKKERSF